MISRPEWRYGSFRISTRDASEVVEGLVCGAFGIRLERRRRPVWTVTHLASGMRATPGGGSFTNLELAKEFVARLMDIADWSKIDRDAANEQLGSQVVAIWNELIARDVVTTFADHYGADLELLLKKAHTGARRRS
jgi:hypothetical protein